METKRVVESRLSRQKTVAQWCADTFGADHQSSVPQRSLRKLEEDIELYQATGGDPAIAHKLIDYVFSHPPGDIAQEFGGVGVTLLALAEACGLDADECELREIRRVTSKPKEHFAARNKAKNDAGFNALTSSEKKGKL